MPYSFGRDITYKFYPLKEESFTDKFEDIALLTDTPDIYVFADRPDRAKALAGTSNLASITSWTNTDDGDGKEFTIPALDDPDVDSAKDIYSYYIAVNFTLQDTEQVQTVIRLLPMRRVIGHASTAEPSLQQIVDIYSEAQKYFADYKIENAVKVAFQNIKVELQAKGFEYCSIWNPDALQNCIAYKALSSLALTQFSGTGVWESRFEEWRDTASSLLSSIRLYLDKDMDGAPDGAPQQTTNTLTLMR